MGPSKEVAHSIALHGCRNNRRMQSVDSDTLTDTCLTLDRMIGEAGFSCFGSIIQRFSSKPEHGYTYVKIIGQSSINIHTYPERGTVTVWGITCPGEDDDGAATKKFEVLLRKYFGATTMHSEVKGSVDL